ncbi:MAG: hypothetical protein DRJ59_07280, partial [Thermoprotei archaeon]
MNKLKSEPRELVDGKTLSERIREAFKFGVKTNVYTAIVRGFLDTILLDLDGRLQLKEIERRREGRIRRPLEGTFAS